MSCYGRCCRYKLTYRILSPFPNVPIDKSFMTSASLQRYDRSSSYTNGSHNKKRENNSENSLRDLVENFEVDPDNLPDDSYGTFHQVKSMFEESKNEVDEQLRKKKYAIAARKLFKFPAIENLLTWAAKEQIRHLHKHDPDLWSVERLAESFPCTERYIHLILKDKKIMYSEDDIIRHDELVKKRWKIIDSGKYDGKLTEGTIELLKSKSKLMNNSAGIRSLPMPTKSEEFVDYKGRPGMFSSILRDYKTFIKTPEAAQQIQYEKNKLTPDKGISYNIGYFNPPPKDDNVRLKKIYSEPITFAEYQKLNPAVTSGLPPSSYDQIKGNTANYSKVKDKNAINNLKEQKIEEKLVSSHSSYFDDVQHHATQLLKSENQNLTKDIRLKKTSVFSVPHFKYINKK